MSENIINHKSLRRSHFSSKTEYDTFLNHFVNPLIEHVDNLNDYIYDLCSQEERLKDPLVITDLQKFKKQIQKHIIWKTVYDSYLPMTHPHEFTILIMNQLLIDFSNINRNSVEVNELKNQHLIILIRFINGLLDYYQKSKYALSLVKLAEKLDIPSWIVDLRHMATHERELPNIIILRKGLVWCLTYLIRTHWMSVEEKGSSDSEREGSEENNMLTVAWGEKRKILNISSNDEVDKIIEEWNQNWSFLTSRKWATKEAVAYYETLKIKTTNYKSGFQVNENNSKQEEFIVLLNKLKKFWKELRDEGKESLIKQILATPLKGIKEIMVKIFISRFYRFDFIILHISESLKMTKEVYPLINFNLFCKQYNDKIPNFSINVLRQMIKQIQIKPEYQQNLNLIKKIYKQKINLLKQEAKTSKNDLKLNGTNELQDIKAVNTTDRQYIFELQQDWIPKPFGVL
ncbi:Las1-domain-containing protein [Hanseniaspora valbyensis NRRL Y-1626]|uniref:Las1-domain-containing protein n=1 Tax=Hanseniaspora valbyensis NRRL Y-1626 TaxID=766949 RepID=A0A1B7TDF9_9ASCO|nr:Las1-domain-containing protein [Hanseniaspora valbyensis NRRL Y-1626]